MNKRFENKIDSSNDIIWHSRFSTSKSTLIKSFKVLKRAEEIEYPKGLAYAKLNLATINFYQSKNDVAFKYLTEALYWLENNKQEKGYVRALLLKGNIYESFGDYETTLKLWLEAYNTSIQIKDIESEGEACNQLGLIYSRLSNSQRALKYLTMGLKIREELNDENAVASSLNRIGMVLRQDKKFSDSLASYFRSLEIRKKNMQTLAIPWTLLGIASTCEEMKDFQESLNYFEQGSIGADKRCTLQCQMGAGRVYSIMGDSIKAEQKLQESLLMARELKSFALESEAHLALATHYELYNKYEKALKSFKQYLTTKQTFNNAEIQNRLTNIEIAHAIERSEHEKEIYRLRHVELKEAYGLIENKNRDITASINYASRIQKAMLPLPGELIELNNKCFILLLPKDIVSGDFYWFTKIKNRLFIAVGDCTGHGVPGALMSMLGISFLEEIVNKRLVTSTGLILDELRKEIKHALHQKGQSGEAKDGMDISVCSIDKQENLIQYSGAYNNLYLIRNTELIEYRADRMPIGTFEETDKSFSTHNIKSSPGDMIYMLSDGFADQFGGPNRKKFKYNMLKSLLLDLHKEPLKDQKKRLEKEFYKWKGQEEQTDDLLIFGMKI